MSIFSVENIPYLGFAALVVALTFWLAKKVNVLVTEAWSRNAAHRPTARFVARFASVAVFVLGLSAALKICGFDASLLVGAMTLAAGYALRSWLSNLVAGILLATTRILEIASFIGSREGSGSILEVGAMSTLMKKFSGETIRVPNDTLVSEKLTIFGQYPERLFKCDVWVGLDVDPGAAIAVMEEVLAGESAIIQTPEPPMILLVDMNGGCLQFLVRAWVRKSLVKNFLKFKVKLRMKLVQALEDRGMEMPYTVTTLSVNGHDSGDALTALGQKLAPKLLRTD